jgi:AhpC/TSA family
MTKIGGLFLGSLAVLSGTAAGQQDGGPTAAPAAQYRALLDAQERASSPGRALSDEERLQFIGKTFRLWNQIALKFVNLAEKHPKDPAAVDALIRAVWQVNSTPWPAELVGPDEARARALSLLRRDHLRSDKLGPLCERISSGLASEYETFLRSVLEESPHLTVRAQACLSLAHLLTNRLQRIDLTRQQPELARQFAALYGQEYLAGLLRQDRGEVVREAEALFERASRDYGGVKTPSGGTVGQRAQSELFEIRNLVVGKEAPDIEGRDQNGRPFRLSDYRGKVVLIDFWSEY